MRATEQQEDERCLIIIKKRSQGNELNKQGDSFVRANNDEETLQPSHKENENGNLPM